MKIAAMKVVFFLLFLFIEINVVAVATETEMINEYATIETRFSPGYAFSIINAMKQLKCDVCRLLFRSDVFCGVICSLATSNTGTTRNPSGTTTTPAPEPCLGATETDFTIDTTCYKYVSCEGEISWEGAKAYCESQNTHLLSLETEEEVSDVDDEIYDTVGIDAVYQVWIGMTGSGGVYTRTLDGITNTVSFIASGDQTKACGVLEYDSKGDFGVNSVDCQTSLPFVCEDPVPCTP